MNASRSSNLSEPVEPGLGFLVAALWGRRVLVLAIIVVCAVAGLSYALLARKWYEAEVVLMAADNGSSASLSGPLDSLASIAGLSPLKSGDLEHSMAVLKSRDIARAFIEQEALLTVILGDLWDADAGRWKSDSGKAEPDVRDAIRYFERHVRRITEDKPAGTITLSVSWTNPVTASEWANKIVLLVNARLRDQAISEAEANIDYLRKQMADTSIAPLQQSAGKLLESELQKLMLARGTTQYAFRVVDAAEPAKYPSKPQLLIVVAAATLVGVFLCIVLVLIWDLVLPAARRARQVRG